MRYPFYLIQQIQLSEWGENNRDTASSRQHVMKTVINQDLSRDLHALSTQGCHLTITIICIYTFLNGEQNKK